MRGRQGNLAMTPICRRIAAVKFMKQPGPLVLQLVAGRDHLLCDGNARQFGTVEIVAARQRFGMNGSKISVDRRPRRATLSKPLQLRVVPIANGIASKHGSSEERLPPQGDQAHSIKITRMEAPQSHRELAAA
jgi:hypothetical protein